MIGSYDGSYDQSTMIETARLAMTGGSYGLCMAYDPRIVNHHIERVVIASSQCRTVCSIAVSDTVCFIDVEGYVSLAVEVEVEGYGSIARSFSMGQLSLWGITTGLDWL